MLSSVYPYNIHHHHIRNVHHCHLDPHDTNLMLRIESHENHRVYTHCTIDLATLPSGKHTKKYRKSQFYSWVNQLFLWSFSIAMLLIISKQNPEKKQLVTWPFYHRFSHIKTSGKRLQFANWKITMFNGSIHYFYGKITIFSG